MSNLILLLVFAALALNSTPAICAEPSDQDHEENPVRRTPATGYTPTKPTTESSIGATRDSKSAASSNSAPSGAPIGASSEAEAASNTPAASPQSTGTVSTSKATSGSSDSPSGTAPSAGISEVKPMAKLLPSEVAPGPYETDRRNVRNWLMEANKRGVGLHAYMPVWDDMEATVKAGAADAEVKKKLDTICRNIGDQVRNSSSIQRFRPVKPKPDPNEGVEYIPVRWIGEKGSDPLFRDKADKWYNNAVDLLTPEQRADPQIRRKLHDQRDVIYKEMSESWKTSKNWAPSRYKNMNQDLHDLNYKTPPRNYVPDAGNEPHKWNGSTTKRGSSDRY